MILGHHILLSRIDELFPKEKPYKIGAASVDVCVGNEIITESGAKIGIHQYCEESPWLMEPGEFLLVAMREHVVVPRDLSCLFLLKSTMARMGVNHMFAGWIDPGWDGMLTMELKNANQTRPLAIWPGMPIGQLIYMQTVIAGEYKGRYQGSEGVVAARPEVDYNAGE
jgi:dCTP deaminase